jgi:hypothetical protein
MSDCALFGMHSPSAALEARSAHLTHALLTVLYCDMTGWTTHASNAAGSGAGMPPSLSLLPQGTSTLSCLGSSSWRLRCWAAAALAEPGKALKTPVSSTCRAALSEPTRVAQPPAARAAPASGG